MLEDLRRNEGWAEVALGLTSGQCVWIPDPGYRWGMALSHWPTQRYTPVFLSPLGKLAFDAPARLQGPQKFLHGPLIPELISRPPPPEGWPGILGPQIATAREERGEPCGSFVRVSGGRGPGTSGTDPAIGGAKQA